ncbi:MAG: hypothetical protein Q7K71_01655 [Candidatus Omnitrophota bacterium]|nr:hypothetical protein [Candidatus Omnitrophota bacterium]
MYWAAKIFQAAGLAIMILGFIGHFPKTMPLNILLLSIVFFAIGWVIQVIVLKK